MLVFLALFSVVTCSPLSQSTQPSAVQINENIPFTKSVSGETLNNVDLLSSSSIIQKQETEILPVTTPVDFKRKYDYFFSDVQKSKKEENRISETNLNDFVSDDHSYDEIFNELKEKRADRLPRNSILPPLIIHQRSESSFEPTEVEAPEIIPTTLSAVIKREESLQEERLVSPSFNNNSNNNNNNNNFSDVNPKNKYINSSKIFLNTSYVNIGNDSLSFSTEKSRNQMISKSNFTKDTHPEESNVDINKSNVDENIGNFENNKGKFKIKAVNNTYTLVHEKFNNYEKSAPLRLPTNEDDSKYILKTNIDEISSSEDKINKNLMNENNTDSVQDNSGTAGGKRVVSVAELLPIVTYKSSNKTLQKSFTQENSYTNEKDFSEEKEKSKSNSTNNSNIQTREVDNDAFFILVDAQQSSRKVKKDNIEPSKTVDENGYRIDVITSSSEVTYKQFDPLKNVSLDSQKVKNISPFENIGSANLGEQNAIKNKSVQVNISENSSSHVTNMTKKFNASTSNTMERSSENNNLTKGQAVTSLPSQTSVVEPIRTNSNSSLPEVTLPSSHHHTKLNHVALEKTHSLASPVATDSVGRSPLAMFPEDTFPSSSSFEELHTPSLQQERLSIHVSERVSSSISVGCVIAIVSGILISMVVIGGAVAYILYRRLEGFRPKILSSDRSCANSDSGGYLDDQCRVAYVNSQIDLPKNTPEDLVSLDNDSFLNSLESMTIQNLWTDTIRHTKL